MSFDRLGTIISLNVKSWEPIKFVVEAQDNEFEKIKSEFIKEKKDAIVNSIDDINRETRRLVKNCVALNSANAYLNDESIKTIEDCIKDSQKALSILKGEKRGWVED